MQDVWHVYGRIETRRTIKETERRADKDRQEVIENQMARPWIGRDEREKETSEIKL